MRYCDETPGVLKWASEEFSIPYISPKDNHPHRYFPDFYLEVQGVQGIKKFVVEIKPSVQVEPPRVRKRETRKYLAEQATYHINQAKWAAATRHAKSRGWVFLVLTEDHLGLKW